MMSILPDFLPGQLTLQRGSARDYLALQQFHYLPRRPATWAGVWVIRYSQEPAELPVVSLVEPRSAANYPGARVAAVGVLSYPVPSCKARERYFARQGSSRRENLEFINANLRTISRVIVHPQFRSLGLASIIVRCLCENCPTRYVEALAVMGRAHPCASRDTSGPNVQTRHTPPSRRGLPQFSPPPGIHEGMASSQP